VALSRGCLCFVGTPAELRPALEAVLTESGDNTIFATKAQTADLLLDVLQCPLNRGVFETEYRQHILLRRGSIPAPLLQLQLLLPTFLTTMIILSRLWRRTRWPLIVSGMSSSLMIAGALVLLYFDEAHTQAIFAVCFAGLFNSWSTCGLPFLPTIHQALIVFRQEHEQGLVTIPAMYLALVAWLIPLSTCLTVMYIMPLYALAYWSSFELDRWMLLVAINALNSITACAMQIAVVSLASWRGLGLTSTVMSLFTMQGGHFALSSFYVSTCVAQELPSTLISLLIPMLLSCHSVKQIRCSNAFTWECHRFGCIPQPFRLQLEACPLFATLRLGGSTHGCCASARRRAEPWPLLTQAIQSVLELGC